MPAGAAMLRPAAAAAAAPGPELEVLGGCSMQSGIASAARLTTLRTGRLATPHCLCGSGLILNS